MEKNLGMGVILGMLSGNRGTVEAIQQSLNKKIKNINLDKENNKLNIELEDNSTLVIFDDGQSCCESRYMTTDDDLSKYVGETLVSFELKSAPDKEGEYGDMHEIEFLDVITDRDRFQVASHNEHNGYYGGFNIVANLIK